MKIIKLITISMHAICMIGSLSCTSDDTADVVIPQTNPTTATIEPGNDPNFTIVENTDSGFTAANRKVVVFGLNVYAFAEVEDA